MTAVKQENKQAVKALQELFSSSYKLKHQQAVCPMDVVCYQYFIQAEAWGKDVITQKFFAGKNHYSYQGLANKLHTYRLRQAAASGAMAGEKL